MVSRETLSENLPHVEVVGGWAIERWSITRAEGRLTVGLSLEREGERRENGVTLLDDARGLDAACQLLIEWARGGARPA